MKPHTGEIYRSDHNPGVGGGAVDAVEIVGTPEQVHAVSRAVSAEYRRKRNARRRVQRASRRGNRGRR